MIPDHQYTLIMRALTRFKALTEQEIPQVSGMDRRIVNMAIIALDKCHDDNGE